MHAYVYVCARASMYVYTYICMRMCMYVYVHTYIYKMRASQVTRMHGACHACE